MIMPRGSDQLLLPVNPLFIVVTVLLALGLNLLPIGRVAAMPDFLALVLAFWAVHQPRRVGVGVAFLFGLVMDVHDGSRLGQHALAYVLMAYGAIAMHRRLLWFGVLEQALQVLPLFVMAELVSLGARMAVGGLFPGWAIFIGPFVQAMLWPIASRMLLAPQRRPPDPDANRPL